MKRKIMYIVYSLEIGGLERVVINLANNLDRNTYVPYICCIARGGDLVDSFDYQDKLSIIGNEGRINWKSVKKIHDIVRKQSINLIHSHNFPGLLYGFLPSKIARVPIVHTLHGHSPSYSSRFLKPVEKITSRSVDRYVCVSNRLKEFVRTSLGVPDGKMHVIYNGIPESRECGTGGNRARPEIKIGSVGRLTGIKNYELLIRAFAKIQKRFTNCRLEFVGGGEKYDDLANLARKLSIEQKVRLHGFQLDIDRFLREFDIFVLPSFSEGHSISILEALNLKKICIVSAVGGNTEIIEDGVNGFLFDSDDLNGLIEKLTYVLEHLGSVEIGNVRENAIDTIKSRFSLDLMVRNYEELYRGILR